MISTKNRLIQSNCDVPLVGDFHFNGHILTEYQETASILDKYRINPGNIGTSNKYDANFESVLINIAIANDNHQNRRKLGEYK